MGEMTSMLNVFSHQIHAASLCSTAVSISLPLGEQISVSLLLAANRGGSTSPR